MRKTLVILLMVFTGTVCAQVVNIENRRVNDGTYGFSGALDMTLSAQRQKDVLVTVHFKPLIQFKFNGKRDFHFKEADVRDTAQKGGTPKPDRNKHLLLLINDLKYTGAKKNTYANFGMSHLRYAYRIGNSGWKWESYTQIQYNQLLLQKVRTLLGTGLRTKIADISPVDGGSVRRAARLFAGTSLFYEYEEINYTDRPMEFNNTVRWSTYLSTYMNFKYFEFSSSTYIQPNIATFKDYRVSGDYVLLVRISDPFSIKFNFSHFYDSRPPETVIPHTYSITTGFVYRLDNFKIDLDKWEERRLRKAGKID